MRTATLIVPVLASLLAGCSGPSVWQQGYVRDERAAVAPLPDSAPVRVREVPWERMGGTLRDLEQRVAASDRPPAEWSPQQQLDAKATLLRGLQVTADPASVEVVGRSEFRTTDTVVPLGADRASLERFARSIGATDAVFAARSLGRADKIVDRPVTSTGYVSVWGSSRRDRDRWWDDSYSHSSTTWVPVKVTAEETGFVVFFLRVP